MPVGTTGTVRSTPRSTFASAVVVPAGLAPYFEASLCLCVVPACILYCALPHCYPNVRVLPSCAKHGVCSTVFRSPGPEHGPRLK